MWKQNIANHGLMAHFSAENSDQKCWFAKLISVKWFKQFCFYTAIKSYTQDVKQNEILGPLSISGGGAVITGNVFFCSDSNNCNFFPTPDTCSITHGIISDTNNKAAEAVANICDEFETDHAPGMECEGAVIGNLEGLSINLTFSRLSIQNETTIRAMYDLALGKQILDIFVVCFFGSFRYILS